MLWTRERRLSSTISARVVSVDATWLRNSLKMSWVAGRCG
jgi:hypothetical protein